MRFAGGYSNVGSYIQAGRAGAKGASDAFIVARSNAPDYGGLAETNMKARSSERIAATKAEASVMQAGLNAMSNVRQTEIKTDAAKKVNDIKLNARRKAGMVGALGAIAGGAYIGIQNKQEAKRQAERDAQVDANNEAQLEIMRQSANRESSYIPTRFDPKSVNVSDIWEGSPNAPKGGTETEVVSDLQDTQETQTDGGFALPNGPSLSTPRTMPTSEVSTPTPSTSDSSSKNSPAPSLTSSLPNSPQALTGLDAQVAKIVRKYESGQYGYSAFNQGGTDEGHSAINSGNWSQSKHSNGRKMTDMTVGEVLDRGRDHDNYSKYPTQASYNDAGQLWAAGAYQFIPDTLADQVQRSGISRDQPFSQAVQDKLFIDHARRNGNFKAWVGVSNVTPEERRVLDQWIQANR